VQALEPAHLFEAVDQRPPCVVVEMYAEEPRLTVELVLPVGYRGLVKADIQVEENAPCSPGQRLFRYVVPPSGVVRVSAPVVFRRFTFPNFLGTYANGTRLSREARDAEVGFWWLKSEGASHTFFVGPASEYALHRPEPSHDPVESPSGKGQGRGRGRRNRGGGQSPADSSSSGMNP
jgi:hypothetical protein